MKVHASALAHRTVRDLHKRINAVRHWEYTRHLLERVAERGYTVDDIHGILDIGTMVEWHNENGTERVVLEHDNGTSRDSISCDLDTRTIITIYFRPNTIKGRNNKNYLGGSK